MTSTHQVQPHRLLSRLAEPYRFNIASLNQVVGGEYGNEYLDRYFRGWIDMAEHPLAELRSCLDERSPAATMRTPRSKIR